jgi:hypothetical protein
MRNRRILPVVLALTALVALAIPSAALAKDLLRQEVRLENTGVEPAADGKAELRIKKKNRTRFEVEVEDLTPANYDLMVDGVFRGVLDVRQLADGRVEAELEFDTKSEPGKLPLSFDPRGKLITVERSGTVYLQVVFPSNGSAGGSCTQ